MVLQDRHQPLRQPLELPVQQVPLEIVLPPGLLPMRPGEVWTDQVGPSLLGGLDIVILATEGPPPEVGRKPKVRGPGVKVLKLVSR